MLNKIKPFFFIAIGIIFYFLLFSKPIKKIDDIFSDYQFKLRGTSKMDSNIVMLYIDKDVMDSLGRVPLKWNYYTRLIDGLSKFGAKTIGIDNVFDKNSPDYPTQASWLVSAIRNSRRVCIGGYFDKINNSSLLNEPPVSVDSNFKNVTQIGNDSSQIPSGDDLDVPFSWLLKNAAGFGHLNFGNGSTIRKVPLVLHNADSSFNFVREGRIIPALGLELVRVFLGLPRDSIDINENEILVNNGENSIKIPTENSEMIINYCGGVNSLEMISISEFLKLYEHKRNPKIYASAKKMFKNKIVLIGLLGNNTARFESTPFETKFLSMGIHANIIDTILRQRFLYKIPAWLNILLSVFTAMVFFIVTTNKFDLKNSILISLALLFAYMILTFFLFNLNIIMSIQPAFIGAIILVVGSVYRYNILQSDAKKIEKEKIRIEAILNKSRKKIENLENSINILKTGKDSAEIDIGGFQTNLINLNNRFDDLKPNEKINLTVKRKLGNNLFFSKNSKMEKIADFVKKISPTDASILIIGESGTGKELIAKAIHDLSDKKDNNFITINCGAIPETLLESELFGHEAGSFTDAKKMHKGYFEEADKGTIFLDEITETNELFQVKLLRVLQSGEINRIGGTTPIKVNVRIIAATNKKIEELVSAKKFREDLYYRLNVIKIVVPPLRNRKLDINVLTEYFLGKEDAFDVKISNSVIHAFHTYNWPGNIRELENVIKRAVILAKVEKNKMIQLSHLPPELIVDFKSKLDLENLVLEKIREKQFSFNAISETADEIGGMHRGTVSEYLKGICFKELCNHLFDLQNTVSAIAGSDDDEIKNRVKVKLYEYLNNLISKIDKKLSPIEMKENLKNTFKKLPKKYHVYVEKIIDFYKVDPSKIKLLEE